MRVGRGKSLTAQAHWHACMHACLLACLLACMQTRTAAGVASARNRRKATRIGLVHAPPAAQGGSGGGIGGVSGDGAETAGIGSKVGSALAHELVTEPATKPSSRSALQPTPPAAHVPSQVALASSLSLHATGPRGGGACEVVGRDAWECGDAGRTANGTESMVGEERRGEHAVLEAVGEQGGGGKAWGLACGGGGGGR